MCSYTHPGVGGRAEMLHILATSGYGLAGGDHAGGAAHVLV